MATQWIPLTRLEPKRWLLTNGEVVKEPPMEQTSTGRKVRVVGTTDSVYTSDLDGLLHRAVSMLAAEKQTSVLLNLDTLKEAERQQVTDLDKVASLHVVHRISDRYAATSAWWRFKHPEIPYSVILAAGLRNQPYHSEPHRQVMDVVLYLPVLETGTRSTFLQFRDQSWSQWTYHLRYGADPDAETKWGEFFRDEPKEDWVNHLSSQKTFIHQRSGVKAFLEVVRAFEELETIRVPDVRTPNTPGWMELELYETNVNQQLLADMAEYLDGAPMAERAAELYGQMLDALRALGVSVEAKESTDFMAALLNGEKESMSLRITDLADSQRTIDHEHSLSVHLPTGTFVVECSRMTPSELDDVAHKWEEAITMAQLTGQENELLTFAKGHADQNNKKRTKEIFNNRQVC